MEMHHRKLNDLLMIMVWHLVHMEWMVKLKTNNDPFCFLSDGVTMELKEKVKEKKKQN
jgi:hypothetical protein